MPIKNHNYELPVELQQKLPDSKHVKDVIFNCMSIFAWMADPDNTKPYESFDPQFYGDEQLAADFAEHIFKTQDTVYFVHPQSRMVAINKMRRTAFYNSTKEEIKNSLDLLQSFGVVSGEILQIAKSGGRPTEIRLLCHHFSNEPETQEFDQKEEEVFDQLLKSFAPTAPKMYPAPVRALRRFVVTGMTNMFTIEGGQVIEDWNVCQYLQRNDFPVCPVEMTNMAECGNCHYIFTLTDDALKHQVLVATARFQFSYNMSHITRMPGDLIADLQEVQFLLENKMPVSFAKPGEYAECPACKTVTAQTQLRGDEGRTRAHYEQQTA